MGAFPLGSWEPGECGERVGGDLIWLRSWPDSSHGSGRRDVGCKGSGGETSEAGEVTRSRQ